jgi:hypothetical protein
MRCGATHGPVRLEAKRALVVARICFDRLESMALDLYRPQGEDASMEKLRLIMLGLAAVICLVLGWDVFFQARRDNYAEPPIAQSVESTQEEDKVLTVRRAVEARFTEAPEFQRFFDRLHLLFPNDYDAMIEMFVQKPADDPTRDVDVMMAEAVRFLRQAHGRLAAKAENHVLNHVFEMQLAVMQSLAGRDQKLCVDFLYGGASQGFFDFSAANRSLVAQAALAGLEAMHDGLTHRIDRQTPSDADFQMLEKALTSRGLGTAEIEALLDGKTPDPPIEDTIMCRDGQIYLETLATLPEPTRMRIYSLAVELMARS